jgi:hypothetical protein
MRAVSPRRSSLAFAASLAASLSGGLALALGSAIARADVALTQVSSDPYTNETSFHATEVEPDTFASGSTLVSVFQVGRFPGGGASNIGWATTTNSGVSYSEGFLPGTTSFASPPGPYLRISDPAVAFDAKHDVWLVNSLAINQGPKGGLAPSAVIVNRSTDGGATFGSPVTVAGGGKFFDKNWITCDDTPASPHFGNCYVEFDNHAAGNRLEMFRSEDGGLSWEQSIVPNAKVIGGQPLVQPNGTVVMPIDNSTQAKVFSFVSTDGGESYSGPFPIAQIHDHVVAGNLRTSSLPSAEVDGSGTVYVAWQDCRFIKACKANDIVFSKSSDGVTWSAVTRIPIDATTSGVDHFIPGLGVDPSTSGSSASLGLTYYFYPSADCTEATCQLDGGFVGSSDGGATWSAPTQLAGPASLGELPLTSQGFMVGDYISASFVTSTSGDLALPVLAVGTPVSGKTCTLGDITSCDEPMEAPSKGLIAASTVAKHRAARGPILSTQSDHAASTRPSTAY